MIEVRVAGEPWGRVADLALAGPDDAVFVVEPDTGTLRFGDGVHGRRLPEDAGVRVIYRDGSGASRPRWFDGRLLSADALRADQDYARERRRLHNRLLHGWGVVEGLEVDARPAGEGWTVHVSPGAALDPCGEEIVVPGPIALPVPPAGPGGVWVVLRAAERPAGAVPALDGDGVEAALIEDAFAVSLDGEAGADGVALARLVPDRGHWWVDRSVASAVGRR